MLNSKLMNNDDTSYRFLKRTIDLLGALAAALLLWWLFVLIWLGVKSTSRGPAIFAQARGGRGESVVTCYKFRTMHVGTKQVGTHEVGAAAVTKFGTYLRRTKLDELPQIVNILRNEMSFVGPRPCLPTQQALVEARRSRNVFDLKPGITGLSQVRNIDMSAPEQLALSDAQYLAQRSVILDLRLIFVTVFGAGRGDKVGSNE